jgi:hypothetical protein
LRSSRIKLDRRNRWFPDRNAQRSVLPVVSKRKYLIGLVETIQRKLRKKRNMLTAKQERRFESIKKLCEAACLTPGNKATASHYKAHASFALSNASYYSNSG